MTTSQKQRFQASSIIYTCEPTMQEEDLKEPLLVEERQEESDQRGFSCYCYCCFLFLGFTIALRCLENYDGNSHLNRFMSSQSNGIAFSYGLLLTEAFHLLGLWLLMRVVQELSHSPCRQVALVSTGLIVGILVSIVTIRDAETSDPHHLLRMLCFLVGDWFVCLGILFYYAQRQQRKKCNVDSETAINEEEVFSTDDIV
jgi:predicted ferric reductase